MKFEAPNLEIVALEVEDVIAASSAFTPGVTITMNGSTIQWSSNMAGQSIFGSCPFDGRSEGIDFVCISAYNS